MRSWEPCDVTCYAQDGRTYFADVARPHDYDGDVSPCALKLSSMLATSSMANDAPWTPSPICHVVQHELFILFVGRGIKVLCNARSSCLFSLRVFFFVFVIIRRRLLLRILLLLVLMCLLRRLALQGDILRDRHPSPSPSRPALTTPFELRRTHIRMHSFASLLHTAIQRLVWAALTRRVHNVDVHAVVVPRHILLRPIARGRITTTFPFLWSLALRPIALCWMCVSSSSNTVRCP